MCAIGTLINDSYSKRLNDVQPYHSLLIFLTMYKVITVLSECLTKCEVKALNETSAVRKVTSLT